MSNFKNITILNSANMPVDGIYNKRGISKNQFIDIIKNASTINSSVGYDAVAILIHELTGITVTVNRDTTYINEGDTIVGLTLGYRVTPKEKGFTLLTSDDYVYFIATYKRNDTNETKGQNS